MHCFTGHTNVTFGDTGFGHVGSQKYVWIGLYAKDKYTWAGAKVEPRFTEPFVQCFTRLQKERNAVPGTHLDAGHERGVGDV